MISPVLLLLAIPRPAVADCDLPCRGFTCGDLQSRFKCDELDTFGCNCTGCCVSPSLIASPPPPPLPSKPTVSVASCLAPSSPSSSSGEIENNQVVLQLRRHLHPARALGEFKVPEGLVLRITEPFVVEGFNASVVGLGCGASIDAAGESRIFVVRGGGHVHLGNLLLSGGSASRLASHNSEQQTGTNATDFDHGNGGAVVALGSSTLELDRVHMQDSHAINGSGGGIWAAGGSFVRAVNSNFTFCTCASQGGALNAEERTSLMLIDCVFSSCSATTGGGFALDEGVGTLHGLSVSNCSAKTAGAVHVYESLISIEGCSVSDCRAVQEGGGIDFAFSNFSAVGSRVANCLAATSWGGGCIGTEAFGLFAGCTISSCRSTVGAAIFLYSSTYWEVVDCRVTQCSTFASGILWVGFGTLLKMTNSVVDQCNAIADGGAFSISGNCDLTNVSLEHNAAIGGNAGAMLLTGVDSRLVMRRGRILNCSARASAGALGVFAGAAELYGVRIELCRAASKGAISVDSNGSVAFGADADVRGLILECTAASIGGGVMVYDGKLDMWSSDVVGCTTSNDLSLGAGFAVMIGKTTLRNVRIERCNAGECGGAALVSGPGHLDMFNCTVSSCSVGRATAPDALFGGYGGGIGVFSGGSIAMFRSTVFNCSAKLAGGGISIQASGRAMLSECAVVDCTALRGAALYVASQRPRNSETRFYAALLHISAPCDSLPLLWSERLPLTLPGLTLSVSGDGGKRRGGHGDLSGSGGEEGGGGDRRGGEGVESCAPQLLGSKTRLGACSDDAHTCGDGAECFTAPISGVHHAQNAELSRLTAEGTPVLRTMCRCSEGDLPLPVATGFEEAAPFIAGCATPRRAGRVSVLEAITESVVLRLAKGLAGAENQSRVLSVTIDGSARAGGTWSVHDTLCPWVSFLHTSGSFGADDTAFTVSLSVSSAGLAETVKPYEANLNLTVVAQRTVTFAVPVVVFVSAAISAEHSVWGLPTPSSAVGDSPKRSCLGQTTLSQPVILTSNILNKLPFTACDFESLAVAHSPPGVNDGGKSWRIQVQGPSATAAPNESLATVSFEEGVQFVRIAPARTGPHILKLFLGRQLAATPLEAYVTCQQHMTEREGECVCRAGYEPTDASGGHVCTACQPGTVKREESNDACQPDLLPLYVGLAVGVSMLVLFAIVAVAWWRHVSQGRMKAAAQAHDRELQIEREFMAVTCHEVRNPLNGTASYLQFALDALLTSFSERNGAARPGETTLCKQIEPMGACSMQPCDFAPFTASAAAVSPSIGRTDGTSAMSFSSSSSPTLRKPGQGGTGQLAGQKRPPQDYWDPAERGENSIRDAYACCLPFGGSGDAAATATVTAGPLAATAPSAATATAPAVAAPPSTAGPTAAAAASAPAIVPAHNLKRKTSSGSTHFSLTSWKEIDENVDGLAAEGEARPGFETMVLGALTCTRVALRVLDNMTTLERLRQKLLTLNEQPEALHSVLADVHTVLEPQARTMSGIELRVRVDETLKDVRFLCDRKILTQVLINIGQNAVRFTQSGFVEICAVSADNAESLRSLSIKPIQPETQTPKLQPPKDELSTQAPPRQQPSEQQPSKLSQRHTAQPHSSPFFDRSERAHSKAASITPRSRRVSFHVRDSGPGIPHELQARVFERYTTRGGVGLGLYLTKLQVEQMGVEIEIRSPWTDAHSGAEFSFCVDLVEVEEEDEEVESAPGPRSSIWERHMMSAESAADLASELASGIGRPKKRSDGVSATPRLRDGARVLLADDQRANVMLLRHALLNYVNSTWRVQCCADAERALRIFESERFDFVIMDEHFGPGATMAGSEVVLRMRQVESRRAGGVGDHSGGAGDGGGGEAGRSGGDGGGGNGGSGGGGADGTGVGAGVGNGRANPRADASDACLEVARSAVIISCTGNAEQQMSELLACGADAVWSKPFPSFRTERDQDKSDMYMSLTQLCISKRRFDLLATPGMLS